MIDNLDFIKKEWGGYSSFCLWGENISDLSIFEQQGIEKRLNPRIIFLGINISRELGEAFSNMHDSRKGSRDVNLMKAVVGTMFEGAYFTDLFKNHVDGDSGAVFGFYGKPENYEKKKKCFDQLRKEIQDLCGTELPLFVILSTSKEMKTFFEEFRSYCRIQYEFIQTDHYSKHNGTPKTIKKVLLDAQSDPKYAKYFK